MLKKFFPIAIGFSVLLAMAFLPLCHAGESAPQIDRNASLGLAHYIMALNYDFLGETDRAVQEYQEALKYDEKVASAHLRLGAGYARLGKYTEAIRELKRASSLDPEDLQPHYFLALIYAAQKDFSSATREYETILESYSKKHEANPELLIYLGQLYYAQGKSDKALAEFEKVFRSDPSNSEIAYLLGNLYLDDNRRPEAESIFKTCVGNDPFHDGCLNSLGYMYAEDSKDLDEAQDLILRALEIDPVNPAYIDSLGWVYYKKGKYTEALQELLKASESAQDSEILDHIGDVYLKLGKPDLAKKYWQLTLELEPDRQSVKDKLQELNNTPQP